MSKKTDFLPMFMDEVRSRGWDELDILLITGDAYVDHPAYGTSLIGRLLEKHGYRVGIIAQPDWRSADDFSRLGRPRLAVLISAGSVDSMVVNYTANRRLRHDDSSPAPRPDRASIVYANRVRQSFKNIPVILGGVEASMRRLAHYDYWDNAVRRSILLDAKADMLIYGMGEKPVIEVMARLAAGENIDAIRDVRGTVVRARPSDIPQGAVELPSFEQVREDPVLFNKAFVTAYHNMSPVDARVLFQAHADQGVLQNPPPMPLTPQELDASYELLYTRRAHPFYKAGVKGLETVRWSITALRGCPGACRFCGIAMHQGRIVQSRTPESIRREAEAFTDDKDFRGTISDVGGPTANLYGAMCRKWAEGKACPDRDCLVPSPCPSLELGCTKMISLYDTLRKIKGIKHVFVQSGIRYDLLLLPQAKDYFHKLVSHHISGQMKVAPEHTSDKVLHLMNKPSYARYEEFVARFAEINEGLSSRKYLVNYFISAHPGAGLEDALDCAMKLSASGMRPEQIQDFLPLPMTAAGCMYHTGHDPFTGKPVTVVRKDHERAMQRALLQPQNPGSQPLVEKALRLLGKEDLKQRFVRGKKSHDHR